MISIVVPVLNSEKSIAELHNRLMKIMQNINQEYEILFIDDGSSDNSWAEIENISKKHEKVKGYRLSKNFGEHCALLCGIRNTKGKYIITLDDDLQHPPEEIPLLIKEIEKGYDLVYGMARKESRNIIRNMGSRFLKQILKKVMNVRNANLISSYRIFKAEIKNTFVEINNSHLNIDSLLMWSTDKISGIDIKHEKRKYQRSNYNIRKLFNSTFNMIIGYSTFPLKVSSIIGIVFSIIGLLMMIYLLIEYYRSGVEVKGFYFLASIITIFAGVQLFVIGIFGEYLSRIYLQNNKKPIYVVKEKID